MRQVWLIVFVCIVSFQKLLALPVGSPVETRFPSNGLFWSSCETPSHSWQDLFTLRAGFYGDYVFNRHMKVRAIGTTRHAETFRLFTNASYLALTAWDRVEVFSTLGSTKMAIESSASSLSPIPDGRLAVRLPSSFSWSVGGKAAVWEWGCTALGIEGQYFRTCAGSITVNLLDVLSARFGFPSRYHEWQVGLGISHRIHHFAPYVAVKYSQARFNIRIEPEEGSPSFKNAKQFGCEVGASLMDCGAMSLTIAARFADEQALYVNGQVQF